MTSSRLTWFLIGILFAWIVVIPAFNIAFGPVDPVSDIVSLVSIEKTSIGDETIRISNANLDTINAAFLANTNEINYCLSGKKTTSLDGETVYVIEDVREADVVNATPKSVSSYPCNTIFSNALGNVHSHPNGNCKPSPQDYYTSGSRQRDIFGIWCGDFRYSFYSRSSIDEPIRVVST